MMTHPFDFPLPDNVTMCPPTRELWRAPSPDEDTLHRFHEDLAGMSSDRTDSMVYLHIPFCDTFCHFCYFTIFKTPTRDNIQRYMDAMKAEITSYFEFSAVRDHPWEVIYFGGGTPSVVPVDMMVNFIDWLRTVFPNGKNLRIEFEGEARSVQNSELLHALAERGCSRISIGTQTFEPKLRKMQNLRPTLADIEAVCENTRAAGIPGLNFDLLYWLPGQTVDDLRADIAKSAELGVTDIDYLITRPDAINKSDPYSRLLYSGKLPPMPTVEAVLEMRKVIVQDLVAAGYERQFGHLFSKIAKARYHTNRYGGDDGRSQTLGIGVSSRGSLGSHIYRNDTDLEAYLAYAGKKPAPKSLGRMTEEKRLQRILFFFPRYMVLPSEILKQFDSSLVEPYLPRFESLEKRGLIKQTSEEGTDYYSLTELGESWYSNVSCELVFGRERADEIAAKYWDIPKSPVLAESSTPRWAVRLPQL